MSRLTTTVLLIVIALAVLWVAQRYGDKPEMVIDAAAPLCPKLSNPCSKINCWAVDRRIYT